MDAVFFFRHSKHGDIEIRYALRGIAKHMPWVRKVWIFGDRPRFLVDDAALVEVVPHEYMARVGKFQAPVTSFFLMYYLAALIPDLDFEMLWFCDDFVIIDELSIEDARRDRYIVEMDTVKERPKGLWQESLWRTYDFLKRLGYTGYNFETHAPTYFTKKRIIDAYLDLKDFITEDRWYGMLGPTAILNHAVCWDRMDLVNRGVEGKWLGFYGESPPYDELVRRAQGKLFFNVDDKSYTPDVRRFLAERFPIASKYEGADIDAGTVDELPRDGRYFPKPTLPSRDAIPEFLNLRGLIGEGVEVGVLRGDHSSKLLAKWRGQRLHCVDPWSECADTAYVDLNNRAQARHDGNLVRTQQQLAPFGDRSQIHRMTSEEAAKQFADGSLDFVYLDARHYREAVEQDIACWAPKVKSGGILAGHDYLDGILPSGHFEVKTAVDQWAAARGLTVLCTGANVWRSWMIEMP